ncbi:MAG: xanthine dehydrogenase family protein molybdopterin-binding subunit [Thermodesulfobacteriota bacterium]|nr:xanthine dehydrogenase family protein molybdopterin-binding subunit [Thermodesulfobacteriota bacterium]
MDIEYLEEVKKLLHGQSYKVVGTDVKRVDSLEKVTGMAKYAADYLMEKVLHVKAVRSPYAHALVKRIDKASALKVPGVEAVITAQDVPGENQIGYLVDDQPIITPKARYIGDIVALVVARDERTAWQGADQLRVEYEELPAIFDPREALNNDIKIHDHSKIATEVKILKGNVEEAFRHCDVIVERVYRTGSQDHAYLEPEAAVAIPTGVRSVNVIGTTQNPFRTRHTVARVLGWKDSDVTIMTPYIGGGFGGKDTYGPLICSLATLAAVKLGRPAMIVYSRYESFAYRFKRGPFEISYKTGATKDGKVRAIQVDYIVDAGGYATWSVGFTKRAAYHATGVYEVGNVKVEGYAVYTNNLPNAAFNGFGNPQMLFAAESQMDLMAEALKMDPVEFRLKNALVPGSRTGTNQLLDHAVGIKELIQKVADQANWKGKRTQYGSEQKGNKRRGVGVGCSWHGCGTTGFKRDWAGASVIVNPDGSVSYATGIVEIGQGTITSHAMMVAEVLGVPFDQIRVGANNTATMPDSGETHAQRGTIIGGTAAVDAALKLRKRMNKLVAEMWECSEDDVAFENGETYNLKNPKQRIGFQDLAWEMYMRGITPAEYGFIKARRGYPDPETGQGDPYAAYTFGCTIAEVEVDLETGQVNVLRLIPGVAAGKIIQPAVVKGQVYGCGMLGLGFATIERVLRKDGRMLNPSYTDYLIPTIKDMPEMADLVVVEDEYKFSGFGAKGVGEIAFIATPLAIVNALNQALGIRFYDMPLDMEKIYFAIREKKSHGSRS